MNVLSVAYFKKLKIKVSFLKREVTVDTSTHEVRLANWKAVIEQCQSRPEGQTIAQWCEQNNVNENQYYYWQRRIRKNAFLELSSALPACAPQETAVAFAEIPVLSGSREISAPDLFHEFCPEAVIRRGDVMIGLRNSISDRLLGRIMKEISHVS